MSSQAITIGSESISGSLQGVEIRTFKQVYQGMMPKIRPLNSNILTVDGQRIDNIRIYDENLTTAVGTGRIVEFPNFEREERSFGIPKEFKDETVFEDMARFDPVVFIKDEGSTLIYPQVLWNLSAKDLDSYDGVIEPLTIRARASRNSVDWPYDPHDIRGAVSNAAEDVRRRCNPIVDYVFPVDRSIEPYLDECFEQDTLGMPQPGFFSNPSDLAPPFEDGTDWEDQENYILGAVLKRYTLSQTLTSWNPSHIVYYTVSNDALVEHDFRSLLVAHLDFEEAASAGDTVVDKTGNGHDGTLYNAATVTLSDKPGYITGRGCLDLTTDAASSATLDNIIINHDATLQASLGSSFSISFWLKFNVISGTQVIFSKAGSSNETEYYAIVSSTGRVQFRINDTTSTLWSNNYAQAQSSILSTGTWYHITLTYDGTGAATGLNIFIDGDDSGTSTSTSGTFTTPRNASFDIYIGSLDAATTDLQGKIASFEFWNVELTTDQVTTLYNLQYADQSGTYTGDYTATLGRVSTEQMFPRGSVSARSGQIVNLEDSPGTDSIAYAGMKR